MSLATARFIVDTITIYLAIGAIFALVFLWKWVGRLDPLAAHDFDYLLSRFVFVHIGQRFRCGEFRFKCLETIPGMATPLTLIAADLAIHLIDH